MKKITLLITVFIGSIGLMNAQNSFTGTSTSQQTQVSIESLITRLQSIGNVAGDVNDYFSTQEQRMLNVHYNGIQNLAPMVITQSNSQTIEAGAGIACAAHPIDFRNNNFYRAFDLAGDFGVVNGFEVTAVEFAIDAITTPSGFPITINIYSTTPGSFPGGTLTLQGTAVHTATNADALSIVNLPLSAMIPAGEAMVMEMVLVDDGTGTNYMTTGVNSAGETGPSYIMATDCGANVPTPFFDLGLTVGMVWNVLGDDEPGGSADPAEVFGINNTTANLISFDPADPTALTNLGVSPAVGFENAGAIDPNNDGTAYVLDNGGAFYSVDLATGVYTSLGNIAAPNGETWAGAEFDASGTLYALSTNIATSTLSTIDIGAATATTIGMTGMAGGISLMIDANGDAYSHDIVDDNFYYVDLATGTASIIGSLGFDANFGQGGTYIKGDPGFVYLSAFDGGAFQSQWRRVDVLTGASTVIGLFSGGADQVAWTSARGEILGVSENALQGFAYYPNPTNGALSLKSVNNIDSVAIYNLLGQSVLNTKVGATTSNLDISGLTTGTYIMKVTVEGQTGTYKVLKN
ncbi:T9SS type A sorting domain-containing protein [Aequorivita sp. SDUM287046]|uniref:T9SS type A sorting domain-containing protein n=1 Tax=Aequorivita aurantiaca TaxID=3053356 RepID=A0ABT8DIZ3_9FLAO|nr:T9SS type A sorting domain-containing protein [Aequorivita aurantiaca]MDN3723880.1 T9SS type A sorting domain-containing protein [Aequorivita aurantiaca]